MKIARQPRILASTPMNGTAHIPAPSLRELSRPTGVTEGVSSDGCSKPMVYSQCFDSEIFERLRSSGYTPSVSLSLDSSLREGAGKGCPPFNVPPGNRNVAGDFHRPYEAQNGLRSTVHRGTLPQRGSRDWCVPFNVPPGSRDVSGDFHRPYEARNGVRSAVHRGCAAAMAYLFSLILTQKCK